MKTQQTPEIIETYFRASNADDIEGLVSCFSTDAVVIDENETHLGTAAIKDWSVNVRKKYEFKTEILRTTQKPGAVVVTAKLSGTFPGSPSTWNSNLPLKKTRSYRSRSASKHRHIRTFLSPRP